jgi:hypothetical protein
MSRVTQFFDEIAYVEQVIREAAKDASAKLRPSSLARLYECVDGASFFFRFLSLDGAFTIRYHSWPYWDAGGWFFQLKLENSKLPKSEFPERLKSMLRNDCKQVKLASDHFPVNCTIPELLHDLYGFPVKGTSTRWYLIPR